jgi:hypothetical protein
LSATTPGLTAILASASEKSREARLLADDDAKAWLEEVRSGARSEDRECVTCGRGGPLEDNHVAGRRHGDLTVPMCLPDHRRFSAGQGLWDPRYGSPKRTPELDEALLLRGFHDLLVIRASHLPVKAAVAYIALADSLREQYAQIARRTI